MIILAPFLAVAAAAGKPVIVSSPASLALLAYLGGRDDGPLLRTVVCRNAHHVGLGGTVATLVEPLSAAILAALLLDERMTLRALVGGSLILAAVVALRPTEDRSAPA